MNASTPVDKSSALWIEWLKFKNSEEYANVLRWPDNTEGNLWCAFESGFRSAVSGSPPSPLEKLAAQWNALPQGGLRWTPTAQKHILDFARWASSGFTGGAPTREDKRDAGRWRLVQEWLSIDENEDGDIRLFCEPPYLDLNERCAPEGEILPREQWPTVVQVVDELVEGIAPSLGAVSRVPSDPSGSTGGAPTATAWLDKGGAPRTQLDVFWHRAHEWRDCKDIDEEYYAKFRVMRDAMFSLIDLALGAASKEQKP